MKEAVIRVACNLGTVLRAAFGPLRDESTHLLMYHRVAAPAPQVSRPTLNVSPGQFARQLEGLLHKGYQFWPLQRMVDAANGDQPTPSNTLAVTFDDGYENMYTRVFPVIRRLKIPITIFVCTKWIGATEPLPFDRWGWEHQSRVPAESWRPLNWDQCLEMQESGLVEIAAHSHSHDDFRGDLQHFARDMHECVTSLRHNLGIHHPNFAFPFGRVDEGFATSDMIETARRAGVSSAVTTEPGPVDFGVSPFQWGRNNVFPWDSAATIDARLCGWYHWLPAMRRWLRQGLRLARHPSQAPQPSNIAPGNRGGNSVEGQSHAISSLPEAKP